MVLWVGRQGTPQTFQGPQAPFLILLRFCPPLLSILAICASLLPQTCFLSPCFPGRHPPRPLGCLWMARQGLSHTENDRKGYDSAFSFIALY